MIFWPNMSPFVLQFFAIIYRRLGDLKVGCDTSVHPSRKTLLTDAPLGGKYYISLVPINS